LPAGSDEFAHAKLDKAECESINAPRVAAAPASLECRLTQIIKLEGASNFLVLGEVTGIHMDDACIKEGRFDITTFQPLSRLGYRDYSVVKDLFELSRPDD
jgi:flavin reductase (DIM6/NTAB) family NADH-FMN oxidoreductase RutF